MSDVNDPNDIWNKEQAPFGSTAATESVFAAGVGAEASGAAAESSYSGSSSSAASAAAAGTAGAPPAGSWGPTPAGYAVPPPPPVGSPGEPNPVLAAFLGLIPGVGAMYNGQFAKGIVHVVVFAVLVFFANNVSDVFGIFISAWILFMAFEAYHTAKARRDGLPLPNAFGWNDIGERMGLGKNWPFSPGGPATAAPGGMSAGPTTGAGTVNPGEWTAAASYPVPPGAQMPPAGAASYGVPPPVAPGFAPGVAPNWAGYVPPSAFASSGGSGMGSGSAGGASMPPVQGVPYSPVSAGAPYSPMAPGNPLVAPSRLPVGAIWLIGLGVLFLLGQWTPLLRLGHVWIPSILLCGVAGLLFARRMGWTGSSAWQRTTGLPLGLRAAAAIRIPGILVAIAVLNGLHEAWVVRWDHSWPWLLICVGVLLLVERLAMRQAANLQTLGDPTLNGGL